jgi:hypothetical protein
MGAISASVFEANRLPSTLFFVEHYENFIPFGSKFELAIPRFPIKP